MWWDRLKQKMDEKGWTKADLARQSGISYDNINKYLRGDVEQPRGQALPKLAQALGCSVAWLRGEVETPPQLVGSFDPDFPVEDLEFDPPPLKADLPPGSMSELASVGGLGSGEVISVSYHRKGEDIVTQDQIKPDYWYFPQDFMRHVLGARAESVVVVPCDGDSMEPTIKSGERVWVNTMHKRPTPDGIYAVRDALGAIIVKRLELIVGEPPRLRIISDNSKHSAQEVGLEEVAIIGKVICGLRMF